MTALAEYDRLECSALWRDSAGGQYREVMISLGEATLVMSSYSNTALSHWSLPAIHRSNPGEMPALFSVAGGESLEVAEPDMVEAIERVRGAIDRARPHPGRLRAILRWGTAAAALALAVLWLPDALTRQTAAALPNAKVDEIGAAILADMTRLSGPPCDTPQGRVALRHLSQRLFGEAGPPIVVLPDLVAQTASLPGGTLVLDRSVVERPERPEVVAGYLLAEAARSDMVTPLAETLEGAGLWSVLSLLTTGELSAKALRDNAAARLTEQRPAIPDDVLLRHFASAQIPSEPYGFALDISGETTLGLIEANPMRGHVTEPILGAANWAALQAICQP